MKRLSTFLLVLVTAAVTSCGGGGGSSGTAPAQNLHAANSPAQPMEIASTTLTATDTSGNTWTVTYSAAAGGMAMFNGQNANTTVIGLTVSENGTVIATEDSTAYYLSNPYSPLGLVGTTNGTAFMFLITSFTPLPSTLTVGDSGPLFSGTYYDGTGMNVTGSLTETYTVTADSPTAVFLNINGTGSNNGSQISETEVFSVTNSGAVTLVEVKLAVNGETLDFK